MSSSGLTSSRTRSAILPCSTVPKSFNRSRNFAGLIVAVCNASRGVKPAVTKRCNSPCTLKPGSSRRPWVSLSRPKTALRLGAASEQYRARARRTFHEQEEDSILIFEDRRSELWPAFFAPRNGSVFHLGIVAGINGVNQPLPALPIQRWTLPGTILCQQLDKRCFFRRIVSFKESARTFRSFH